MATDRRTSRVPALRVRAALVSTVLAVSLLPALVDAPAAQAAVPASKALPAAIDAFASYQGQTICSPTPKAGAVKLSRLLTATYGSYSVGISRSCSIGGQSEHKEGRALDWMVSMRVAGQKAKAESFLAWLLAPGSDGRPGEMARRLGVMHIGWNDRFWASYRADSGWTDLKGCSTDPAKRATGYDTYCHRNHVHLSLSWEGAAGYTSYWSGSPLAAPCQVGWSRDEPSAAGLGTDLVPVTPVRVLDTRSGAGLELPCRPTAAQGWDGTRRDVVAHVTGVGDVPAAGVAAVAVRVTAWRAVMALTTVSVRTTASSAPRPVLTAISASSYASTTVVPVATDGTIRLAVDRGSADLLVDVVGWVPLAVPAAPPAGPTAGPSPDSTADPTATPVADPTSTPVADPTPATDVPSGRTQLTKPVLVYDGSTAPLLPGEVRTVRVGGVGPLPASGLTGVALTLTAARTAGSSYVGVLTPSMRTYVGGLRTSALAARATQLVAPTSDGTLVLRNTGAYPAVLRLYANAWFTTDASAGGGSVTMLGEPVAVVDSAARLGLSGPVTSTASRLVALPTSAVPAGARGVLLAVSATGGSSDGTLVVGSRAAIAAVSFGRGQSAHEVVLMPLLSTGAVAFRTASLGTGIRAWVLGYVA